MNVYAIWKWRSRRRMRKLIYAYRVPENAPRPVWWWDA